ncbi:MAG: hypothetical protein GY720_00585 [bacterium]|nr:hypothetical protein [bacterium]
MVVSSRRGRRWSVRLTGLALVVAGCGTYEPAVTEPLLATTGLPDTSGVETVAMSLVPYIPEEAFLNHPTLLPEGWELCRHLERVDLGDRFCDPNAEDVWIQIGVEDAALLRLDQAEPIEGSETGLWLSTGENSEAAFPSGPNDVFVVIGSGLADVDLINVAESIPLVSGREILFTDPEPQFDLDAVSDEELVGLLDLLNEDVRVTRRDLQVSIFGPVVILRLFPVDGPYVSDVALRVPQPRQIAAERPLIVGESQSQGRSYAIWEQQGYGWRLEGQMTIEEATTIALDIIEQVAALQP